jgi:hypothetical protein
MAVIGACRPDHHHHADTAVEGAVHFKALDIALFLQPRKYGTGQVQEDSSIRASAAFRQHARQVAGQAAAGDMGQWHEPAWP